MKLEREKTKKKKTERESSLREKLVRDVHVMEIEDRAWKERIKQAREKCCFCWNAFLVTSTSEQIYYKVHKPLR